MSVVEEILPSFELIKKLSILPRRDDCDVWIKRIISEFEPDLIIPFSCRTVADGGSASLSGNLNLTSSQYWAGEGCTQQIPTFIKGVPLKRGEDDIGDELTPQINGLNIYRTCVISLFLYGIKVFLLPNIPYKADNIVSFVDEPFEDH